MLYSYCLKCLHECDDNICGQCKLDEIPGAIPSKYEPLPIKKAVQSGDPVNHPTHYATGKYECIEVMREIYGIEETQDFCLLNAFKYLWRCKRKKNKVEDIDKAKYYLNEFLKLEDEKHGKS